MSMFYFDEKIKELESQHDYIPIIRGLEAQFAQNRDSRMLTTIIGYSWFYSVEGNVKTTPKNYDRDFLLRKWKEYVDIGLIDFTNCQDVCLIIAYSLNLHWLYLDKKYEGIFPNMYKKSVELGNDNDFGKLASYFNNHKFFSQIDNAKGICQKMFPSESMVDEYFREILISVMIP